jgi:hypothetical protein
LAQEVDEAQRSGRTSPLPTDSPCRGDGSLRATATRYEVRNSTEYDLRVILSGPVEQEVRISPNSSQTVTLPAGTYRILGKVASPNVLPFFGQRTFPGGAGCASQFYLENKP